MKQRLAIALALIGSPRLLILDEPVNGLDPEGIADVRVLLAEIQAAGTTVLLSSHLLAEVEQICSHVGIIDRGHVLASGPIADFTQRGVLVVRLATTNDRDAALAVLRSARFDAAADDRDATVANVVASSGEAVAATLASAGLYPTELRPTHSDLERRYLDLVGSPKDALD